MEMIHYQKVKMIRIDVVGDPMRVSTVETGTRVQRKERDITEDHLVIVWSSMTTCRKHLRAKPFSFGRHGNWGQNIIPIGRLLHSSIARHTELGLPVIRTMQKKKLLARPY